MERAFRLDRTPPGVASHGYTLLELVVVTSLIAILAAAALPDFSASENAKLNLAAVRVAEAVRFARAEAIRTGEVRLVEIDRDLEQILVATADLSGTTAVPGTELTHPLTKQPYRLVLPDQADTSGVVITGRPFDYPSGGKQPVLLFDAQGLPFHKLDGNNVLLTWGEVKLTLDSRSTQIMVAPITGRVTLP